MEDEQVEYGPSYRESLANLLVALGVSSILDFLFIHNYCLRAASERILCAYDW